MKTPICCQCDVCNVAQSNGIEEWNKIFFKKKNLKYLSGKYDFNAYFKCQNRQFNRKYKANPISKLLLHLGRYVM